MADTTTKPHPDNPTIALDLDFGSDGKTSVVIEFHFSDNVEDFVDVSNFVYLAAGALRRAMSP